jgi:mannose-6-phosphate isomerase-like protein (cupin superfamily)
MSNNKRISKKIINKLLQISIVFVTILTSLCLVPYIDHKVAYASDEKYKDLIGEWSAVWPGDRGDRSTIVIHEVNEEKSKARITYNVDLTGEGREEYEFNADFSSKPPPTLKFNVRGKDFTCVFYKRRKKLGVSFVGDFSNSCEMRKRPQVMSQIDDLLEKNPLPDGKKAQLISIVESDATTINLIRSTEGAGLKPHFHRTHNGILYAIKGEGQLLINDKWVDFKSGSVHFNPLGKTHTIRQVGTEPFVFLSIFTPGMESPDRQFVE